MSHPSFSGVITAIATPFKSDFSIDDAGFTRLLQMQKKSGISGVVVAGTTGESPTLSEAEREHLVNLALAERTDDFHVYVGTGTNDTKTSVEASAKYAKHAHKGVKTDGVMAVVPYYNKPPQLGLYFHFRSISEAVGSHNAFCVYNVPGRTGAALAPQTFVKLVRDCTNVVAIKEAAGDVKIVTELANGLKETVPNRKIEILSGDDPTYAPSLLCGATGVISVTTHLFPEAMIAMLAAAREGNFKKLQQLQQQTYPLNSQLFCAPNPIALKWALGYLAICENVVRPPLSALEPRDIEVVKAAIETSKKNGLQMANSKN